MTTLRDPFQTTHEKGGFTYISWSQAADRLDEVTGGDWSFTIISLTDDWCHGRLTIGDRSYENVGYAENADAQWKKEPLKDAVSDAFKRCAALAGVARYLYDKDSTSQPPASSPANSGAAGRSPRPVASTTPPDLEEPPEIAEMFGAPSDYDTCPDHNVAWRLVPAGVSKTSGKAYAAFWACPERGCKEKPAQPFLNSHRAA